MFSGLLAAASAAEEQHPSGTSAEYFLKSSFPPLELWKSAVLAGDKEHLKLFYISNSEASAKTPVGMAGDPSIEESEFWSGLLPLGLTRIAAKVLERTSPSQASVSLVLRIELTFQTQNDTRREFVSTSQLWVFERRRWRILKTQRSDVLQLPSFRLPQPEIPNTHLYPDPGEAGRDLDAALASSKDDRKRVLVIFGANWCYDCHVLDAAMRSKDLEPMIAANYHVVHINISEGTRNTDLARRFQIPLDKGIPSLAILDSSGQLLTSQKEGEFESAAQIGMADVSEFLIRWRPNLTR